MIGTENIQAVIIVTCAVMSHTIAMSMGVTMTETSCLMIVAVVMPSCSVTAVMMMAMSSVPMCLSGCDAYQAAQCC